MQRIIFWLFGILLFLVPLILWPATSEVFEFNKMVLTYMLTTLITAAWAIRMVIERKIIFRRTILDIPLLIFFSSQLISTILSIDPRTSLFGYYSRFNGGLLSTLCYSLLYWAFVSNVNAKEILKLIYVTLASATLVSAYGVLQHFGIDKNIWVQDVQNRVFSTLGQPNWLASFLVALIPLTWTYAISDRKRFWLYFSLSALFFITLLFTKSRSGFLGFAIADLTFWGFVLVKQEAKHLKEFFIFNFLFLVLFLIIGNPFRSSKLQPQTTATAPVLETGGTESGTIRKIVWKGAFEVWKHYPVFGTGVETFAYSYYKFRPPEHNLVSEWDFIYNKAHNEYLNMAANSGTVGLSAYLFLIGTSVYLFIRKSRFDLLAGYAGLLISNFFGFSVVPTQLLLFLFPAFALKRDEK